MNIWVWRIHLEQPIALLPSLIQNGTNDIALNAYTNSPYNNYKMILVMIIQ